MKNSKNEVSSDIKKYNFFKDLLNFFGTYENDLDSFLYSYTKEFAVEIIEWDLIYSNYKDDALYSLYSNKKQELIEINNTFVVDLWLSGNETSECLINIKESTINTKLQEFIQNIFNIPQRRLFN